MAYLIIGTYPGQEPEEIDVFDTLKEAQAMLREYTLAYGPAWTLYIKRSRTA